MAFSVLSALNRHHTRFMQVEVHVESNVGQVRKNNEDNYLLLNLTSGNWQTSGQLLNSSADFPNVELRDEGILLGVSDGMGGALAGEVASQMAVEMVRDVMTNQDMEITLSPETTQSLVKKLYHATVYTNREIHRKSRTEAQFSGMGATFTSALLTPQAIYLLQVGDSRAYLFRHGKIKQVTQDQSLVQQLVDSNQITAEDAETHPLRNVILQALGAQSDVMPVCGKFIPQNGDIFLLCSDGLSGKLKNEDLQSIVNDNTEDLSAACHILVEKANERGGEDNITVVLAKLTGDDLSAEYVEDAVVEPVIFDAPQQPYYGDDDDTPTSIP
jgi:PPM family protein phosphatase